MHQCQAKTPNEPIAKNEIPTLYSTPEVKERIKKLIAEHPVIIFMKGNAEAPRCGFSANSCMILKEHNANFHTYDILKDPDLRLALKEYSDWPTFPQIYIEGTLVGGNDILTELATNGELKQMLG
jgi:monothiol glutaredoxin